MATVVVMPQLGNSVESCLIVSWQVKVGDEIAENAIVCEVETDKASMEVPTSAAGTVLAILWDEGDDVPVKEPLLVVSVAGVLTRIGGIESSQLVLLFNMAVMLNGILLALYLNVSLKRERPGAVEAAAAMEAQR